MNRRAFAKALAMIGAAVGLQQARPDATPSGRYGRVDVERWQREGFHQDGARVLLDGLDITDDCNLFDDNEGWADVHLRNEHGKLFFDPIYQGAAKRRVYGRIVVDYRSAKA